MESDSNITQLKPNLHLTSASSAKLPRRIPQASRIINRIVTNASLDDILDLICYEGVGTLTELEIQHPDGTKSHQIAITFSYHKEEPEMIVERPNGRIS